MSGRLVILPKKSWNVWNQDNREKVKRDERLAREHQEALERAEKERVQERNVEQLLNEGGPATTGTEPFRLFGDLEEQSKKHAEQVAAKRLQEEKDLLEKRRQGIAPWALGEGAAEKAGAVQPWYLKQSTSIDSGPPPAASDDRRKAAEDPMHRHLKQPPVVANATTTAATSSSSSSSSRSNAVLAMLSAGHAVNVPAAEERKKKEPKEKHKEIRHKESKKRHKKDKRHRDDESEDGNGHGRKARRRGDGDVNADGDGDGDGDVFAALRRKRLERERVERRREAHLLAQADMYGPATAGPALDERTLRYHSQYNPALARPT